MEDVLDVLAERGLVNQVSDEAALRRALRQPITLYCGYDATATSLHIGHVLTLMMLAWFQRYGHRPIALAGGGTTLVGDPTFRDTSRPILSEERVERNVEAIKGQMMHFLDFADDRALLLNNAIWLTRLNFVEFMRDIGARFSVNEVLRLEAYRTRLEAGGLSFLEFSYFLMQSYDFLRLYEEWDCILQIGGSDQWGNSIMGADLIRRVTGGEAFVLTAPLISTAEGAKMGKSTGGAVSLDISPYDYYQYWRNTPDTNVEQFLAFFTFLPMEEVRALGRLEGIELNRAKEVLAFEATKILHGEQEARRAEATAHALFGGSDEGAEIPSVELERARLEAGVPVTQLFKEAGLVSSANEARNLIRQGGITVNDQPITDAHLVVDLTQVQNGDLMLSRGKKQHRRVVLV